MSWRIIMDDNKHELLEDKKKIALFLFGLVLMVLFVGEINSIRLYFKSNRVLHQGATVEAVVSEVKYVSSKSGSYHVLYVDYEIDGTKYTHVHYGTDYARNKKVGDTCVAYYDINNHSYAISEHSVDDYAKSCQNGAGLIAFAIIAVWFVYYIKKEEMTKERIEKGLMILVIALILACIILIKNEIS